MKDERTIREEEFERLVVQAENGTELERQNALVQMLVMYVNIEDELAERIKNTQVYGEEPMIVGPWGHG